MAMLAVIPARGQSEQKNGTGVFIIDDLQYVVNRHTGNVSVWSCYSDKSDIVIPSQVTFDGTTYIVDCIDLCCFKDNEKLVSVTLPETIKNIYSDAFSNCINLKSIYYSSDFEYSVNAFENCNPEFVFVDSNRTTALSAAQPAAPDQQQNNDAAASSGSGGALGDIIGVVVFVLLFGKLFGGLFGGGKRRYHYCGRDFRTESEMNDYKYGSYLDSQHKL